MRLLRLAGAALPPRAHFLALAGLWTVILLSSCVSEETSTSPEAPHDSGVGPGSADAGEGADGFEIVVVPEVLDFSLSLDQSLVVLGHSGNAPFSYTIDSDADWVSIDEPNGLTTGPWKWVYVRVDRSGLTPGEHVASLSIDVLGQARKTVGIRAVVPDDEAIIDLYVSAQRLDFGYESETLSFLVGSSAQADIAFTVESDVDWATLSPTRGFSSSTSERILVTVKRTELGSGMHTGIVRVEAGNGETREVSLSVSVADPNEPLPPTIEISANLLDFGAETVTLSFELHNSGTGTINYALASQSDWLTLSPQQGENSGEADVITATVDRSRLSPGSYVAPVEIVADGGLERELWALLTKWDPNEPTPAQIAAWLEELDPLPKVHYSWPLPRALYEDELDPRVREYVRIAHSACLYARWVNSERVDTLVGLCHEINQSNPEIPARLGVVYLPWTEVWPEGYPPTYEGPEHDEEIALCRQYLENVRDWLAAANASHAANIEVAALLLECENWARKKESEPGHEEWNAALDEKYNVIYLVCKDVFPDASVDWYARGEYYVCKWGTGICEGAHFTLNELGDSYSISLYRIPELGYTREVFRLTAELADVNGVPVAMPWIALAAGYRRETTGIDEQFWWWDWDFDVYYSWQLGAEINDPFFATKPERFAPWNKAEYVAFHPEPFGRAPSWGKHFVAYVRGAHGITELPE